MTSAGAARGHSRHLGREFGIPLPVPVTDIDQQVAGANKLLHSARNIAVGSIVVALVCGMVFLSVIAFNQQRALIQAHESSCTYWKQVALSPIVSSNRPVPGVLAVVIEVAARAAFVSQECGNLPPAGTVLAKWALYYHVKL